jgi:hypothetical protein
LLLGADNNGRRHGNFQETSNFQSATLPQNASYVLSLEVSGKEAITDTSHSVLTRIGFISPRPPPRNTLPETIANAIAKFVNLSRVIFAPLTFHEDLFAQTLRILPDLRSLTDLTVNQSCTSDLLVPKLVEVNGLKKLTLFNPGRAILQLLPDWLRRLSPTLTELHLKVSKS